jgi:eight-cysteine-cluster-containing protein
MSRLFVALVALAACAESTPKASLLPGTSPPPADIALYDLAEGGTFNVVVSGAGPGDDIRFLVSRTAGLGGPCVGAVCVDVLAPITIGIESADGAGDAEVSRVLPASLVEGDLLFFQAIHLAGVDSYVTPLTFGYVGSGLCLTVDPSDVNYDRYEGTASDNSCVFDADCTMSGCSGEVCAAVEIPTTCDFLPDPPTGSCGCVSGQCAWNDVCP